MTPNRETPQPDAALLDLCRRWHEVNAEIANDGAGGARLSRRSWQLFDQLTAVQPKTLTGVAAQAAIVRAELQLMHTDNAGAVEWTDPDTHAAFLVLGHVERLAKASTA